jgi:hypothetical protein
MRPSRLAALLGSVFLNILVAQAQVPQLINYQGRIIVGTTNFNGTGQFKFALINGANGSTLWRNHGSGAGEPANAVALTVTNGLYSVLLGDATLTNMAAIPNTVFNNQDVRLRVWFSDGSGFHQLNPDQRIAAVGYAMMASSVVDGAITNAKLDPTLAAELPRKSAGQTFTGANTFSNTANQFSGNGSGLTQLNASALNAGTVLDARLSNNIPRLNAANDFTGDQAITGRLGVGTTTPTEDIEVRGPDAAVRIRNSNDAIGAWLGDSWGTLQLGIYNPSASTVGVVPANTTRSFFGMDGTTGKVGSLTNNFGSPAFRVVLDDGAGNMTFGSTTRQMLNLWGDDYGIGVQNSTLYQRTGGGFAWFRDGSHSNTQNDPGGGTRLMKLDSGGNLEFNNMPGLHFGQANPNGIRFTVDDGEVRLDEISIRAPAAGYIFITAFADVQANVDTYFRLYDVSGSPVILTQWTPEPPQNVSSISWVLQVNQSQYVNLKTTVRVTALQSGGFIYSHNLTAIYIPVRYQ